jgi:hypothetical protein
MRAGEDIRNTTTREERSDVDFCFDSYQVFYRRKQQNDVLPAILSDYLMSFYGKE